MLRPGLRLIWPVLLVATVLSTTATTRPTTAQPFSSGPWLATGEIDDVSPVPFRGDSAEIITGPGAGEPPLVKIVRVTQVPPSNGDPVGPGFLAYDESFLGGVRVATCDLAPGDPPLPPTPQPTRKIVTGPGPGMEPRVRAFGVDADGLNPTMLADFVAFDQSFTGGVFVACGDVDLDGVDEIIAATGDGAAVVRVFKTDGAGNWSVLHEFIAFDPAPLGGIRVAAGDLIGDQRAEVVVGRGSGAARIRVFGFSPQPQQIFDFLAFTGSPLPLGAGGVFVASARLGDVNSIIAGSGPGFPARIRTFAVDTGTLVQTLSVPPPAGPGGHAPTGIIVTGGRLTAALDSEVVFARAGGSTRVRSIFFIGTPGRVDFDAY